MCRISKYNESIQNATWCQNRGCFCISSVRRTYGRIHSSFLHTPVIQTSTIILWTELFPKKRREKIQGEILQSIFRYRIQWCFHNSTRTTCNPASFQSSCAILHTELILLQEILQLQVSSRADQYKAPSSDCSPCLQAFYTAESSHKAPYSIPGPHSTSRLPVILSCRNSILSGSQHPRTPYSSSQASSTLQNSTRRSRILSKRVKYCMSMQY